jgi:uridine kinase
MLDRAGFLSSVATRIHVLSGDGIVRVAIDGVDGAGKTTFANELATVLRQLGRSVIRASVDDFHNPRAIRYRRGRSSFEGFFRDSYDYESLKDHLLDPLSVGGSRRYRTAVFDHLTDQPIQQNDVEASLGSVLLLDGIFLHRPELRSYWDFSVFLDVRFEVSIPRGAQRGEGFGSSNPESVDNKRYVEGQRLYLRECSPAQHATLVVDNNNLAAPRLLSRKSARLDW